MAHIPWSSYIARWEGFWSRVNVHLKVWDILGIKFLLVLKVGSSFTLSPAHTDFFFSVQKTFCTVKNNCWTLEIWFIWHTLQYIRYQKKHNFEQHNFCVSKCLVSVCKMNACHKSFVCVQCWLSLSHVFMLFAPLRNSIFSSLLNCHYHPSPAFITEKMERRLC